VFVPAEPVSPDTLAWCSDGSARSHADVLERAAAEARIEGDRLLTDVHPAADEGVPAFLAPIVHHGSLVLLRHPAEATWAARRADERTTTELRQPAQPPSR
ncbi:MAG: hypothetical protein ABWY19_06305, partial [Marmoricola sp.]